MTALSTSPVSLAAVIRGQKLINFKTVLSETKSKRNVLREKDAAVSDCYLTSS